MESQQRPRRRRRQIMGALFLTSWWACLLVSILSPTLLTPIHGFSTSNFHAASQASIRATGSLQIPAWSLARPQTKRANLKLHAASIAAPPVDDDDDKLPSSVTPILLSVLALIISEGISLSTLPLHMQSLGATPAVVGLATSAFSIAQMVCCPLIVRLSTRIGRQKTLGLCLIGAALSSTVIACSTTIPMLILARFLAGAFAASAPVAQAGVTDLVPPHLAAVALSRVSAASQTGLVIGPIVSAIVQTILKQLGVPAKYTVRCVFAASALFALFALAVGRAGKQDSTSLTVNGSDSATSREDSTAKKPKDVPSTVKSPKFSQPLLRVMALAAGWAMTLSVAIYSLFASKFLGYAQTQLSTAMSMGAATTIATQMFLVPRLVRQTGEHRTGTIGLYTLAFGLAGASLVRMQPLHSILYVLIRVGTGTTDTATAALVARYSKDSAARAANLGMIQSTRAAARIFSPVLSGSLFARSCVRPILAPGALPYLANAALALLLAPIPLILKKMETSKQSPETP